MEGIVYNIENRSDRAVVHNYHRKPEFREMQKGAKSSDIAQLKKLAIKSRAVLDIEADKLSAEKLRNLILKKFSKIEKKPEKKPTSKK